MINRLERTFLYMLLVIIFGACSTEDEAADQQIPSGMEISYVATIGKGETRTIYTEAEDANNNNRPYLKALWGGKEETKETITLYAEDGTSCDFTATIPVGGNTQATFVGFPKNEGFVPLKAYYSKSNPVTSLSTALDLTNQRQGPSGSTAHISGQDFMVGQVTLSSEVSAEPGSIQFKHLTAVVKYILNFTEEEPEAQSETSEPETEEPQPLQVTLLSLRQRGGESVLKLRQSFNETSVSTTYPQLDLRFMENNGAVSVPMDNSILEAYVSIFPSSTQGKKFKLFAKATTGFYESAEFTINQNFEAGNLYTITTSMKHLVGYDWYMSPQVDDDGNQVYTVSTAEELAAFANIVNGDAGMEPDSFDGKIVKMTSSISLKGYQPWTPIGKTADTPFKGTFDGCHKTISDLKTDANKDYQGFFGFLDGATIKNLTIEGEVEGKNYVGAVAAYATNSTFEDCTFGNPNFSDFHVSGLNWIGSVIGYAKGSVFEQCVNYGQVTGGEGGYVGGLGGGSDNSSLKGCTNYGGVAVGEGGCGGGLMGLMNGGYISGCANHGEMTSVASMISSILANIAGEMANKVQIIGSYSDGKNGSGVWGFGTGDYIVNGSYYTDGKGDDEWYRESLSPEDYANMNELINGEGWYFDEDGNLIDTNPTDFGGGNVNDFGGGGYLK
ncbi:MAG: hypothetical protein J6J26_02430 [Bacteroides sp.]|nr:hypothetical protein [Bacteroides sp.]